MPGDPNECREHAKHCLELAESAPPLIAKIRFQGLAHSWLRLADDLDHAEALLEHWGDPKLRKTG
jgi:hypothetical protein